MKKLILCLVLMITLILTSGCINSRPPEFQINNPYAISDGSGGAVVTYQVNNGKEIHTYVQRLDAQGKVLWGKQGVDLGARTGGIMEGDFTSLIRDQLGHITVVYYSDKNIRATKLDMDGHPVWEGETTRRVSPSNVLDPVYFRAIGNGLGETIITWIPDRDHISILKADSNFNYVISLSAPEVDKFDIASDDRGNVFILWKDKPSYSEGNIFIQKVDTKGHEAWPDGGFQLTGTRNPGVVRSGLEQTIISDGTDGVIAIWMQGTLNENGKLIIRQDLYAQHFVSEGNTEWGENGKLIASNVQDPRIARDNQGNILVFWSDAQNVYAQKMDVTGKTIWDEPGIKVGRAGEGRNVIYYYATENGKNGNSVVWNYSESGDKTLRAQCMDASGGTLWGDNGVQVSSVSPYWGGYSTPARILSDGTGGLIVTWSAGENIKDKTSSYIQKISGDGQTLWGQDGIKLNQ